MQIVTRQVEGKPLTVTIEYPEYNESTMRLIQKINSLDLRFSAYDDNKQIRIELSDVYYIENVERKLFIYTKKDVSKYGFYNKFQCAVVKLLPHKMVMNTWLHQQKLDGTPECRKD